MGWELPKVVEATISIFTAEHGESAEGSQIGANFLAPPVFFEVLLSFEVQRYTLSSYLKTVHSAASSVDKPVLSAAEASDFVATRDPRWELGVKRRKSPQPPFKKGGEGGI